MSIGIALHALPEPDGFFVEPARLLRLSGLQQMPRFVDDLLGGFPKPGGDVLLVADGKNGVHVDILFLIETTHAIT